MIRSAAALNTNLTTEITHLLPRIEVPTRILWGEDDVFQLIKYGERLAADIPGASIVRIADARHFITLDQSAIAVRLHTIKDMQDLADHRRRVTYLTSWNH